MTFPSRRITTILSLVVGAGALLSHASAPAAPADTASPIPRAHLELTPVAAEVTNYSFRYEGLIKGTTAIDTSGKKLNAAIRTAGGFTLTTATDAGADTQGKSFFTFPPKVCGTRPCPQAMLVPGGDVNPSDSGKAPFGFGARVKLPAGGTTDGQNVLERGRATKGTPQWKLQVDHRAATCRFSDSAGAVAMVPKWGTSFVLESDRWYDLRCYRRAGNVFALVATDPSTGTVIKEFTTKVSAMGPIQATGAITIAAKFVGGIDQNTDQFRGSLDDIWFATS